MYTVRWDVSLPAATYTWRCSVWCTACELRRPYQLGRTCRVHCTPANVVRRTSGSTAEVGVHSNGAAAVVRRPPPKLFRFRLLCPARGAATTFSSVDFYFIFDVGTRVRFFGLVFASVEGNAASADDDNVDIVVGIKTGFKC